VPTDNRVLVTGAGGFLGGHVAKVLKRKGFAVAPAVRSRHEKGCIVLDVRCKEQVGDVFRTVRPTHVVHCAAYGVNFADQDPRMAIEINVLGSLSVMEAAAEQGVQHFLHIGSCFEYGSKPGAISEAACAEPTGVYGASKAAATLMLIERARALGVPLTVARPFGMWGPGEADYRLLPQIVKAWRRREPLDLTLCDVVRDYTFVEDMAEYVSELLEVENLPAGAIVNLGSGRAVELRGFVLEIADLLGIRELMRFGRRSHRAGEMASLVADVSYMRHLLGKMPETTLAEGLRRMGVNVPVPA
jgi:nucleoside-diphosphate-sugar epimerase